ncbi:MAG: competence/damage-inducible protein A [Flavobacteriaceae bacterium]|nr:MAG: competence/damage-inducible protein A [Flavobacteriaceae bacterium]
MNAEIITIGDEILIGQIVDTNSQWLSQQLNEIGVSVYQITSIQDDRDHILKAIKEAESNADIVILTGGLGPTKDDITKITLAEYFEDTLVRKIEIEEHIKQLFAKIKYKFTDMDMKQAMLPSTCKVLKNHLGTASGMWFDKEGKVIVSLPGVPNEMKGLIKNDVIPGIRDKFHLPYIIHKTLHTYGMGESRLAERLQPWEDQLPSHVKLAYLPSYGKVRLRLSAKGNRLNELRNEIEKETDSLRSLVYDILVGEDLNEALEISINNLMQEKKLTLSLAESCTGGNISKMITTIPGASNFLKGALIAYNERVKTELLGVDKNTIDDFTVVSKEVAEEMAVACRNLFGSDFAVSTTGNAGPTKDETDKSVGVVFIGIATPEGSFSKEYYFGKPRSKVIERASVKALELLRKEILKNPINSLSD